MGRIKVLSELAANKIAAGEVIERPSSVVKELMENSLDAQAHSISVSVKHGGKSFVKVKDNGHGMDRQDARACLLRHATSKILEADEIEKVGTLGFRGEALPSIAAVSRLALVTRRHTDDTAIMVNVSAGKIDSMRECVSGSGTVVTVADLFFNIPARRKFLKSDAAEYNAIADVFNTLALSRYEGAFSLYRNDLEIANFTACGCLMERIRQVYGQDSLEKFYPINIEKTDFNLTGYIGLPNNTRINRTGQKFFINGRPVQSISLSTTLSRAYSEFLQQRRFPVAILFLEINPSYIDVNVHPAKREVRIRNERFFQDIIVKAIRAELQRKGLFSEQLPQREPEALFQGPPVYKGGSRQVSLHRLREATVGWQPTLQPEIKQPLQSIPPEPAGAGIPGSIPETESLEANPFGVVNVMGQILGTYIIAETGDGFIIFDQHAAHERIVYEELLDAMINSQSFSQKVVFPIVLNLNYQESALIEKHMEDFQSMGFGINPLGNNTFSLDAIPSCLSGEDAQDIMADTIHELLENPAADMWKSHQHKFAAILACKAHSVKAGKKLAIQEMEHLIKKLGTRQNPHICPHGRPTFFIITKNEIEKRFKRK